MINIVRDPRWGSVPQKHAACRHPPSATLTLAVTRSPNLLRRNLESAGEDPFLSGQYAANWVQGLQTAKEVPYPLQAAAWQVPLSKPVARRPSHPDPYCIPALDRELNAPNPPYTAQL